MPASTGPLSETGIRAQSVPQRLAAGEILVADGAMGTQLFAAGLTAGVPAEVWNQRHPARVMAVHRAYVQAGAQIILTNTFGGSRLKLAKAGQGDRVELLNRAAAALAREAAGAQAYVAGDIGPGGEMLEPLGALTYAQAVENFAEQARALVAGGVDLLWVETQSDLEEARAAIAGVKQVTDLPVFCSFSFGRRGKTMMGVSAQQALETLWPLGLAAIGANCGEGLEVVDQVLSQMQALDPTAPLIAKANAGLPKLAGGATVYSLGPQQFADQVGAFVRHGARVVGACCGSQPEFIAAIAQAVGHGRGAAD